MHIEIGGHKGSESKMQKQTGGQLYNGSYIFAEM
jgi:hypothetical protein